MTGILEKICAYSHKRTEAAKNVFPADTLKKAAAGRRPGGFKAALAAPGVRLIAEIKRASPSKGLIAPDFDYLAVARSYASADALSVLTEPRWFMGGLDILAGVRAETAVPILRKDFLLEPYNVYEAAAYGADAVLLIVAALSDEMLATLLSVCRDTGLDALVETHTPDEADRALSAGADIIGVNSRDLTDFSVDTTAAAALVSQLPGGVVKVLESGVTEPVDVARAASAGADAVLVGETLMRADDRAAAVAAFRRAGGCYE